MWILLFEYLLLWYATSKNGTAIYWILCLNFHSKKWQLSQQKSVDFLFKNKVRNIVIFCSGWGIKTIRMFHQG